MHSPVCGPKSSTSARYCMIVLFTLLALLGSPKYSTADSAAARSREHIASSSASRITQQERLSRAADTTLAPFLDVVPDSNGTDLLLSASGVGELGGTVFANFKTGPTSNKGSYTMTFSNTQQAYFTTATVFAPLSTDQITMSITTTLGLDTGITYIDRAYVQAKTTEDITSHDSRLQLSVITTDTLTSETYVAIAPSFAPPGPAPAGHRFVGNIYSARASGALTETNKPMLLHLAYDDAALAGADPHTLAIFAWVPDPNDPHWERLGGQLFADQSYVSVATARFTTYALMATTIWRDEFDDFGLSGIDQSRSQNITLDLLGNGFALALQNTPGQGVALSQPITATSAISGWGELSFTAAADPPSTTLAVDVLDADGTTVLLANAASGARLDEIDLAAHPSIRLRARLASNSPGQSPKLDMWQISWQTQEQFYIFLPTMAR